MNVFSQPPMVKRNIETDKRYRAAYKSLSCKTAINDLVTSSDGPSANWFSWRFSKKKIKNPTTILLYNMAPTSAFPCLKYSKGGIHSGWHWLRLIKECTGRVALPNTTGRKRLQDRCNAVSVTALVCEMRKCILTHVSRPVLRPIRN